MDSTLTAEYVQKLEAFRVRVAGEDEVLSVTTSVARHSEGLGSFLEGAFYGNFSDNDSWSATAGQIVGGLNPVADARDIAAGIYHVAQGRDGAWFELGTSALGAVPLVGDVGKGLLRGGEKVAADLYLAQHPQDTYRTQAGQGTAIGDGDLRARVASGGVENTMTAEYVGKIESFRARVAGEDETLSVTTSVARHGEGLGSFAEGIFKGGFSDNDSYSKTAGEIVGGLIPVYGQVADARDTAAAVRDVWQGKAGAGIALGAAVIGWVPLVGDSAKSAIKAGRKILKEGAEEVAEAAAKRAAREGIEVAEATAIEEAERAAREIKVGTL